MQLLEPLTLGERTARNRVVFGPHETNLGRDRSISDRHVAYYRRRAAGGTGVVVVEEASVHPSDWPYERCPLAAASAAGWHDVATACQEEGALVFAAIGHAGGQGSSAYSQAPLWAPSRVPEVNTREVPKWMEPADIAAVISGFQAAAELAMQAGLDGVEVNAGQYSLVRQFLSGLTNHRDDVWGTERLRFATEVLAAVRRGAGAGAVVGLRLSCDELAPWAGIVPEVATDLATALADAVDYITVVRGSIYTASATRADGHVPEGFNLELARLVRTALPARVAVIAQGSIVEVAMAAEAVDAGACDAVEMTRAQIADPDLVAKAARGEPIRPCLLCNQACQVRDARNPIVSCVVEPTAGHETEDPPIGEPTTCPVDLLVVGGGVSGLECARVGALRGHRVRLVERSPFLGGMALVGARGAGRERLASVCAWLEAQCRDLGVLIEVGRDIGPADVDEFDGEVVLCTGSLPGHLAFATEPGATVLTAAEALDGASLPAGPVAVWDPIGGPIGVSVAEWLRTTGRDVHLITPDLIAGNELSRTGDLAPSNVRLLAAGVVIEKRSILRRVTPTSAVVEDRFTGACRTVEVSAVVDAGYRLPDDRLWRGTGERLARAGDAVAPRSMLEAILEGRRRALELA